MTDAHNAFSPEASLKAASADLLRLMWSLRHRATHAFTPLGLSPFQAMTLFYIAQGHTSPKALASVLHVSPPAVSSTLAEFEVRGLVERLYEPQDKRKVEIRLTDRGNEAAASLEKAWRDAHLSTLGGLGTNELHEISKVCLVVLANETL